MSIRKCSAEICSLGCMQGGECERCSQAFCNFHKNSHNCPGTNIHDIPQESSIPRTASKVYHSSKNNLQDVKDSTLNTKKGYPAGLTNQIDPYSASSIPNRRASNMNFKDQNSISSHNKDQTGTQSLSQPKGKPVHPSVNQTTNFPMNVRPTRKFPEINCLLINITEQMERLRKSLIQKINDLCSAYKNITEKINELKTLFESEDLQFKDRIINECNKQGPLGKSEESIKLQEFFITCLKNLAKSFFPNDVNLREESFISYSNFDNMITSQGKSVGNSRAASYPQNMVNSASAINKINLNFEIKSHKLQPFPFIQNCFEYFKVCNLNLYCTVCLGILETLRNRIKIDSDFELLCNEFFKLVNIDAKEFIVMNYFEYLVEILNNVRNSNANNDSLDIVNNFRSLCGVYIVDESNKKNYFKSDSSLFDIFIKISGNQKYIFFPKREFMNRVRYLID